jgi:hypothetical protein
MAKEPVRNPELARLVKEVIQHQGELDPWLEFPQSGCCFTFGEAKVPLPIGALYLLWETDKRWRKVCPNCNGDARGLTCGGFLSNGWFEFICIDCSAFFVENPGGLGSAWGLLGALKDSEFRVSGGSFGGAYGSNGAPLLRKLDLSYTPKGKVQFEIAVTAENAFDERRRPGGRRRRS